MSFDLQRFCAIDDIRDYLLKPWRFDGWVYATNGHICVRVPDNGSPDTPERTSKHPKAHELFVNTFGDGPDFLPMPDLPAGEECPSCKGAGLFSAKKCEACDGEGVFYHAGLEYDRKSCDRELIEEGWVILDDEGAVREGATLKVCNHCWGRKLKMQAHPLGDATYELAYLLWLAELPGIKYRTNGELRAAAVTFDGGQALLMPRRP